MAQTGTLLHSILYTVHVMPNITTIVTRTRALVYQSLRMKVSSSYLSISLVPLSKAFLPTEVCDSGNAHRELPMMFVLNDN